MTRRVDEYTAMVKEPEKASETSGDKPAAKAAKPDDRKARLAEALRANLRRRKEARKSIGAKGSRP